MENILSNQWIIGIIVGIVSGLIVYPITKHLSSRFDKKDYHKKIRYANNEIKNYIVNAISEGNHLPVEIIKTLKSSVSRKYEVIEKDILTINEILEDVIRVIFDTNFISIDNKIKSANTLLEMKVQNEREEDVLTEHSIATDGRNKPIYVATTFFITAFGIILSLTLILVMINEISSISTYNTETIRLLMISVLSLSMTIGLLTLFRIRRIRKKNEQEQQNIKKKLEQIKNKHIIS